MIDGVVIQPLKQIIDERGKVMHMIRSDSPLFTKFGEIYFSIVNPGAVKAWKRHLRMTQHFAVPVGKIKLVIYDDRLNSVSRKKIEILEIGEDNYHLVRIPPLLWYGFKGISKEFALVANCTDMPHEPVESEHIDPYDKKIPYNWNSSDE
ncbi:dTDP-4-dehydrorhamnose 3,5-epimerase [Dissulfurispira thermophila]|uniref:dTDP-4-dehydrorhamnose 3,5-epimerase n=2 Tax=root TaxID=1 RepID=A0A7G1H2Y7_9BACT|nr:dTDP-4-dehydrorhamnose 3,5-epimerase family protein [Dissulfurispira thermophila]BCB96306.1 dTDP-4-dehydrorhamnose 3,5-epimerase [Dissulfurispira thermophila]